MKRGHKGPFLVVHPNDLANYPWLKGRKDVLLWEKFYKKPGEESRVDKAETTRIVRKDSK